MSVLQTKFPCGSGKTTVSTVRVSGETIAQLAARHDLAIAAAMANCANVAATLGPLQSSWIAESGDILYASETAYGKAQHDKDVVELKGIYPPEAEA